MSFQVRNGRRDTARFHTPSSRRQEWVPRGSTATVVSPPASVNSNQNGGGGDSNCSSALPDGQHRGNSSQKGHMGKQSNPGGRREREKQDGKGFKHSNIPQLVQEIQEKLMKGTVECMICYDMVRRSAAIWSCSSCYSIFHLICIKKWARAPTSVDLSAEKNQGFNWRCPGCQAVQLTPLKEIQYVCFCGKRPDPPSDLYLTPHSCGEPCGKQLEKEVPGSGVSKEDLCPHICVLQCHPGPCPPCKAFAPPRLCPCGKKRITTRCSDRKSVLTCGQRCNKLLDCWRHQCDQVCHLGPCDPCDVMVDAFCFCKKKVEVVRCGAMAVKGEVKIEDGVFSCSSICGKKLSCGNHFCGEICHPGLCGECDLMPSKTKTCYCGKTSLLEERQSCLDPIPTCSQICGKRLPCGKHQCKELCHAGDCAPCLILTSQKCRCGSTSRTVECYKTMVDEEKFTCEKPCGRKKNCGRHRCSERCCPLSNSNNSFSGDWDPHICSMSCGKKLRCGQHSCESLCHSGHCPPCLETIFTDLMCACGRTSIPPPLPCGTPHPSCQYPCSVPQPCGHTSSHSCHFGDCPPCSIPVAKECIGGHVVLRNIPCGSRDIRCNKICGKTRQCGMHACLRTCHPPPCDSSCESGSGLKAPCGQTCGAPRRDCRHTCSVSCHPSSPCPDKRCDFPVTITCSCSRITATVPCDAGGVSGGFNTDTVFEASIVQKLPVPLQPVEANGKKIPLGQRKLMCDEECTKLERRRVLADAFDITPPNLDALHFGENFAVSELLLDLFRRDSKWVLSVEERCKFLVLGKSRGSNTGLRVHVFCPMLKEKRDAVRLIAERWKLSVNAAGWEPKRFIVVHVTPKSKAPSRVLGTKGSTPINVSHPPVFDHFVDMDPRLVVALLDLPRDADISALVLRFGGECELVWLNDKNALAVFSDPARAATAMRRLDHGSVYHGAVMLQNGGASTAPSVASAWGGPGMLKEGGALTALKGDAWKKAVVRDPGWKESSWGGEEWSSGPADMQVWKGKEAAIAVSVNRWNVLDSEVTLTSSASSVRNEDPGKQMRGLSISEAEANASCSNSALQHEGNSGEGEVAEVVDDWEKAYE
ncbi:NF-X1-type zinc finger protein NFXL1 [Malania oleifera]|uniref:NF-X1-type zinc finger protein NFXL1 n=1 Tax=Malania oleifera TaxID=397392 RepID=UPI0025AE542F|nr:NF-X1-type zinc finger protein NFXL1 [Malania oleifera]XP_057980728.1 NF-X1-type zinc finger protein NFXL1 [Malania oleifera]